MKQINGKRTNERKGPPIPQNPFGAYKRGYGEGFSDAINSVMNVVVFTLIDNEFMTDEEVNQFADRFKSVMDMMEKGNITLNDVKRVLKKEYDWRVDLR